MKLRVPEKVVQEHIVRALRTIGAHVYILGRPGLRDRRCPKCHQVVHVEQGTRQTPGIPDLMAFLPMSPTGYPAHFLQIEVKAIDGRRSEDQKRWAVYCEETNQPYLCGGLDVVLAYLKDRGYVREYAHYHAQEAPTPAAPRPTARVPGLPRRARASRQRAQGVDPGQ